MAGRSPESTLPKRLLWFAGLWLASVLVLTAVAFAIRLMLMH